MRRMPVSNHGLLNLRSTHCNPLLWPDPLMTQSWYHHQKGLALAEQYHIPSRFWAWRIPHWAAYTWHYWRTDIILYGGDPRTCIDILLSLKYQWIIDGSVCPGLVINLHHRDNLKYINEIWGKLKCINFQYFPNPVIKRLDGVVKKMMDTLQETWDEHIETYNPGEYFTKNDGMIHRIFDKSEWCHEGCTYYFN